MMSYWTFSDVFEEQGVVKKPFYGGYGLIAERGIPKAAFNAFLLLHLLGTERLPFDVDWALATRRADGSLALAVWNYFAPEDKGRAIDVQIDLTGAAGLKHALVHVVDAQHGSALTAWEAMGQPAFPTRAQVLKLIDASRLPPPERRELNTAGLHLHLAPHALAVVEVVR
jgi:xylan 1,4-beta-xylosidase